jgi:hypothetical protein
MDQINEFVDERNKGFCIHCGGPPTTSDHVPSKCFLQEPFPTNPPTVPVCAECNEGFSLDEEYFVSFLSAVLAGSTASDLQGIASAGRAFQRSDKLKARIERSKTSFVTRGGDCRLLWKPEHERINRVILKNARGHAFFELGEPTLGESANVWALPVASLSRNERDEFEGLTSGRNALAPWPEAGSRMMTRVVTGQDLLGDWVIVQEGTYRYAVAQVGGMRVRSVVHEYLATEVLWDD